MKEDKGKCKCPFCDIEVELPFCKMCEKELTRCSACGKLLEKDATSCSKCGQKL